MHREPQPLDNIARAVEIISDVTGSSPAEVAARLQREHQELGTNVREDMLRRGIPPYRFSDQMSEYYAATDAFLYETYCWNRYPTKQAMRKWIVSFLQKRFANPALVLAFGDGLGFDSAGLALAGHRVTYFEIGKLNQAFSERIFTDNHVEVARCNRAEDLPLEAFDVVICLDVLEHVPQPADLMRQLAGWLKPGGFFIVHAPFWLLGKAVGTHLRDNLKYSGDWRHLYRPSGLRIVDGTLFWNPLVLQKTGGLQSISMSPGTWAKVSFGRFLLRCTRWCRFPLTWICRYLLDQQRGSLLRNTVFPNGDVAKVGHLSKTVLN